MHPQCQEKNDWRVEKEATTRTACEPLRALDSQKTVRAQEGERQSCDEIVPTMRDDSRAKTSATNRENAEESTEHREQNHVAHSLVSMCRAKKKRR